VLNKRCAFGGGGWYRLRRKRVHEWIRSGTGMRKWGRGMGDVSRVCDMSGEMILDRGSEGGWEGV
jgi:hypothetical protein